MIDISCIIPVKDESDQKLQDLIVSIRTQEYPQDRIEIIPVTEGDSEEAKGIGIRKARGKICAMFCTDNLLVDRHEFASIKSVFDHMPMAAGVYTKYYFRIGNDNSLNRYFSLMGNNDPVIWFLGKADRRPHYEYTPNQCMTVMDCKDKIPSFGDNGFYFRRDAVASSDTQRYYPMDVCVDMIKAGWTTFVRVDSTGVLHKTTDGNLFNFLKKRYVYARDLYCYRYDRRWKAVETGADYWKLALFVLATITVVPTLCVSLRGYAVVKDKAWFWHWPVCVGFLITYGALACRNIVKNRTFRFASPARDQKTLKNAKTA
jgi:hypothetical protein